MFLYSDDRFILEIVALLFVFRAFKTRNVTDEFILTVLSVQLNLEVILFRMNFVGNFSLLDNIPNELKIVQEL